MCPPPSRQFFSSLAALIIAPPLLPHPKRILCTSVVYAHQLHTSGPTYQYLYVIYTPLLVTSKLDNVPGAFGRARVYALRVRLPRVSHRRSELIARPRDFRPVNRLRVRVIKYCVPNTPLYLQPPLLTAPQSSWPMDAWYRERMTNACAFSISKIT